MAIAMPLNMFQAMANTHNTADVAIEDAGIIDNADSGNISVQFPDRQP